LEAYCLRSIEQIFDDSQKSLVDFAMKDERNGNYLDEVLSRGMWIKELNLSSFADGGKVKGDAEGKGDALAA
jgi:hypothetical protein